MTSEQTRSGIVSGLLLAAVLLGARSAAAQELEMARLEVSSRAAVDSVRGLGIDVVSVRPRDDGTVELIAVVSDRDRLALAARGFVAVPMLRPPLLEAMEARRRQLGPRAFTVYRDFDDPVRGVAAYLRSFAQARSNVQVDSIGASVEGRPILAVKIGPAAESAARPNVIYVSTYHAREWAAADIALRLIEYLADSLPATAGGAQLLAERDVWVLPVVNPDGYQYTFTAARLWRKNRRPNSDGSFGVDLNRNHATFFALDDVGSSPEPSSQVYRGTAPESEPETQAVAAFHRAHPPAAAITYHTYTASVLYPWGHRDGLLAGDDPVFRALAGTTLAPAVSDGVEGSTVTYYHPGPGWHLYPTNGDYADWAYGEFGTAAFTLELTSGCCLGGQFYGFEFPDSNPLLEQVFRDQLPFALNLLEDAADLSRAVGPSGVAAGGPAFESVWPEARVLVPAGTGGLVLDLFATPADRQSIVLVPESLGAGAHFKRLVARGSAVVGSRALRVAQAGLVAEVLTREGAERSDTQWTGFRRTDASVEGDSAWLGSQDTLRSPAIVVADRRGLTLFFWQRHGGSVFDQARRGRVEVSADGGVTWTEVYRVAGSASAYYPVAASLAAAEGAFSLRLRFIAENMDWYVDAIAITAGVTTLFDVAETGRSQNLMEVSANPVRAAPVTVRWPAGSGGARVELFSLTGARVAGENLASDSGRWVWNLESSAGRPVANGVYLVVVTRSDGTRLRRRLFVAR